MKVGFYNELDELRQEDALANFGFLENVDVTKDFTAFNFLHGLCDEFAAMLSDVFGYEIECVRNGEGRLIHAYCTAYIGEEKAYIDVRGITTDKSLFFEEFDNELTYFPQEDVFYVMDEEGFEITTEPEVWNCKDELFDGDYEGWSDENIKTFIVMNSGYYNETALQREGKGEDPMLSNEAKALYEIFEKHYLERGYMYSGMIPYNAASVLSFDYNVYRELIDAGILQQRDTNAFSFELTVPVRKELIDEFNLSEIWETDPYGRIFYPNRYDGEVTRVNEKFAALENEKRSLNEVIQSAASRVGVAHSAEKASIKEDVFER